MNRAMHYISFTAYAFRPPWDIIRAVKKKETNMNILSCQDI